MRKLLFFCDQYPDIIESFLMLHVLRIANSLCRFPGKSLTPLWLTRAKHDGMEDGIQVDRNPRVAADFQQMKLLDGTFRPQICFVVSFQTRTTMLDVRVRVREISCLAAVIQTVKDNAWIHFKLTIRCL